MKKFLAVILALICVSLPLLCFAEAVTDAAGNAFATDGGKVDVDGDMYFAFQIDGGSTVSGNVGGDLLGAAQEIMLEDLVIGGSLRAAANELKLKNVSLRNMTVLSNDIAVGEDCSVKGLYCLAGTATLLCDIPSVSLSAETVYIYGNISDGSISADTVYIKKGVDVSGVKFTLTNAPMVFDSVPADAYSYTESDLKDIEYEKVRQSIIDPLSVITSVVTAILFAVIFKKAHGKLGVALATKPMSVIGFGLALLGLTPVLALMLILTRVTAPFGVVLFMLYIAFMIFANAIASCAIATAFLEKFNRVGAVALISAVLSVAESLPAVGGFVSLAVFIMAFGASINALRIKPEPEMTVPPLNQDPYTM